jgi:hypothetical protein
MFFILFTQIKVNKTAGLPKDTTQLDALVPNNNGKEHC